MPQTGNWSARVVRSGQLNFFRLKQGNPASQTAQISLLMTVWVRTGPLSIEDDMTLTRLEHPWGVF